MSQQIPLAVDYERSCGIDENKPLQYLAFN